jgi:hypothetical protein
VWVWKGKEEVVYTLCRQDLVDINVLSMVSVRHVGPSLVLCRRNIVYQSFNVGAVRRG